MKQIEDMDESEFLNWASGYLLTELGRGEKIRSILYAVITYNTIRLNTQKEKRKK